MHQITAFGTQNVIYKCGKKLEKIKVEKYNMKQKIVRKIRTSESEDVKIIKINPHHCM